MGYDKSKVWNSSGEGGKIEGERVFTIKKSKKYLEKKIKSVKS